MSNLTAQLKQEPLANVNFKNEHPRQPDCQREIVQGLIGRQKTINPKYFYDTHGSELFEKITRQPEYYPTRTERRILTENARDIAACLGQDCVLIEPGSGSSEKVRLLLPALRPKCYVPLDIAAEFLHRSAVRLGKEFSWLDIRAICADFADLRELMRTLPSGRKVVFYPGSTIGNMTPEQAQGFLKDVKSWVGKGGGMLIGVDLHKDESRLNAAYNDAQGLTAEFNINVLSHINRIANANFDTDYFEHEAFYNERERRIEMHLVSRQDHIVRIDGRALAFSRGESIHTENSYKHTIESFKELVQSVGFQWERAWLDEDRLFSVHYLSC